ncbi:uncharacterized protein E0L32_010133 [Thyridium curvatum]|uniref:Zn(2)-C6 fungal-type domain-containing protein n=1 Tax=Thyridium curvatum TaxID=1093900 RepID=A0A507ALG5_9PEZI|nr:uncharacterized protein E0L32_010133 [Thyridium curvatum]TPX08403.1 hypothetical protein E0L32_010133 [Thyridium curvatum]
MQDNTVIASMSAPRQKNCSSCVRAKRRCDRRTPVCSRCVEKKLPCNYAKGKTVLRYGQRQNLDLSNRASMLPFRGLIAPGLTDVDYFGIGPMEVQSRNDELTETRQGSLVLEDGVDSDIPIDPLLDIMDNAEIANLQQWLVPVESGPLTQTSDSSVEEELMSAYQKMSGICHHVEPWDLYDTKSPLYYVINRVKGFTADIATRSAAPFLHRRLYRGHTPQCIFSCFTTASLYANQTTETKPMVMRALQQAVQELLDAETGRAAAKLVEKLARAQALFLYQVIRLFDGDILLRSQAENDLPLLQAWLEDLLKIRENIGSLAELENEGAQIQVPVEWEHWIFAESLRRTIVMAYAVVKVYELMKHSDDAKDPGIWGRAQCWTLSRHLWEADSTYEFQRMWREKPPFIINNFSFDEFLKHGRGEDVDEFAEILLSVYLGVDETKEFISAR